MIQLEQLRDAHHSAFEVLLREAWQQTWDDDLARQIVQWRYYDRPGQSMTLLAMDQDHCVAMVDSMLRPYLLDGQRILVRETADWYCTPPRRPHGIGLLLLRRVSQCDEPMFVLGGSDLTMNMLPKLHWLSLPAASSYVMPTNARGLVANLVRHRRANYESKARVVPNLPLRRPKRIEPLADAAEMRVMSPDDEVIAPTNTDGLVELLDTAHWRWLARMPSGLARPIGLLFSLSGTPVGMSFSQIEPAASSLDARIVHLQYADPTVGPWIVSATTRYLVEQGVGFIRCCASTAEKIAAIEKVGFIKTKTIPCHWLPHTATTPSSLDVGYLRGDDAIPWQALRGRVHHVRA